MNFQSINDDAPSGVRIHSSVELLYDETEPFARLPWRARTMVAGSWMSTSHHATCAEARRHNEKMHAAYLEVHSSPETVAFYAEELTSDQIAADVDRYGHIAAWHRMETAS